MKAGYLSEYFKGVAAKRLSAVEADVFRSHQHEFNGVEDLKRILGPATGKKKFSAKFVYLADNDDPVESDGFLTWYDAREKHPTRSEHRLYFPTTIVSQCAAPEDLLIIGLRPDDSVLVVVAENGSTLANQLQWLFGLSDLSHPGFSVREELETDQDRVEFLSRFILENIGVEVNAGDETYLDIMLKKFGTSFPSTRDFSAFARSTLKGMTPQDDPDATLMAWMEREEILFRTLERHFIADRLAVGFEKNTDGFISFSLSVQNRRKSRVGLALENHIETIFLECCLRYARAAVTEGKSKPDFLFPGAGEYFNPDFQAGKLVMLGVKSTCKDRWRQVLAEADRIENKHLLTLETAISISQTDEMRSKKLQLVLPKALHLTYSNSQQGWLMDLSGFITLVRERQKK